MHQTFRFLRCALCLLALVGGLIAPAGVTRVESRSAVLPNAETLPISPLADFQQNKQVSSYVNYDGIGYSVAISGDTMVAGGYHFISNSAFYAYVFERDFDPDHPDVPKADNWGLVKKLAPDDGFSNIQFALSVAIEGDVIAVSGYKNNYASAVYIYERNYDPANPSVPLANNWGQVKKLVSDGAPEEFTTAFAVNGDTLVVGAVCAPDNFSEGCPHGTVYIFSRNYNPADPGTPLVDNWGLVKKINTGQDLTEVAIQGDLLAVGLICPERDSVTGKCLPGVAKIYARNYDPANPATPAANNWGLVKQVSASDGTQKDKFGSSLAISADTLVVGANCMPYNTNTTYCGQGAAYVFSRDYDPNHPDTPLANNWGQVKKLVAPNGVERDYFGISVALSDDIAFIGAWNHPYPSGTGSVYVFDGDYDPGNPGTPKKNNWGLARELVAGDAAADGNFGMAVSISGDTLAIGAPGALRPMGAAYIFERDVSRIFIPLVGKHD